MPKSERAEIASSIQDLTEYRNFLKRLAVGQVVTLPLAADEKPRGVVRALNAAAREANMRILRLSSEDGAVRFKVVAAQKRTVSISPEAKKALATRAVGRDSSS